MDKKVIKMKVITNANTSKFNTRCSELLALGYQPSSEFITFTEGESVFLCQQFCVYEENEVIVEKERKEI